MKEGEKLVANDGYEVMLFPIDEIYITQSEYGAISHQLAMDFVGWNGARQIPKYPYYAPASMRCVYKNDDANGRIWQTLNPVHLADGSLDYACLWVMHDEYPIHNVEDTVEQGALLGHSGTFGSYHAGTFGDHLHINTRNGTFQGIAPIDSSRIYWELTGSSHVYDTFYVNDTTLYNPLSYNWKTWGEEPKPPEPEPPEPDPEKHKNYWKYWYLGGYTI